MTSKDGWAIGGPATTFSTGIAVRYADPTKTTPTINTDDGSGNFGKEMNNGYYQSPGSEHSGGANYGMADGSVHFISETMDVHIFALMGSMADDVPLKIPDL
jgi:prepilin-type processing-associated H-X9-DG protein